MPQAFAKISLLALLSGVAFGQSADTTPKFDTADIRVSPKSNNLYMSGGILRAGRYEIRRATLLDLIRAGYKIDDDDKILGGPNWLELDRFDVIARAPASATQDTATLMLQALLADRFKLKVHMDSKPMASLVLMQGKGKPKMTPADGKSAPGCRPQPNQTPPQPGSIPKPVFQCRGQTMEAFTPILRGISGGAKPVVDKTGLEGSWDFDIAWTPQPFLARAGDDSISIFDAVDKQLGLKLEPQQLPTPVIVVDGAEKPVVNPENVTTALPPRPPAEFEVADIKPSAPGATPGGQGLLPGGRIDLRGWPLKLIIQVAWNINDPDQMIAGAPKFVDSARFDIIAKASGLTAGPANALQVDIDDLRLMLQALLIDRFKMKVHYEDHPVSAYVMTATAKPKLQKADPLNRTGCKEGPGADGKDPRIATPVLSRLLTCRNMTLAQLAEQLPNLANGYVHAPVLDSTGLTDAWDFTLSFSAIGVLQNFTPAQQPAGDANTAPDPSGGMSLPDAMNKQLGIKMELRKRPLPVLVIDHVEEKPTEN